ncbi:unnamed protein product [Calypogeia fissa]
MLIGSFLLQVQVATVGLATVATSAAVEEKSRVAIGKRLKLLNRSHRKKVKIPVIDIGGLFGEAGAPEQTVQEVKAAAQFGYFFIINHGIDTEVLANLQKTAVKFFHLLLHEKDKSSFMYAGKLRIIGYGIQNTAPADIAPSESGGKPTSERPRTFHHHQTRDGQQLPLN